MALKINAKFEEKSIWCLKIDKDLVKKGLLSPFSFARNKIYLDTDLKEELTNLFWKLTGYSLFPHRQSRQGFDHFANMINIITLYIRDSLEDK